MWAKTSHVCAQTEIHLIATAFIATLINYGCSLPPLANVDWSVFPEGFLLMMLIYDWWNGPKGGLQFGCGDLIWLPLSVHVCLDLVVEYWPFVGTCTYHSYSKLFYLCLLSSLFKLLLSLTPSPCLSRLLLYICWPNINQWILWKNHQKLVKTSHYPLARLVVQKLIVRR